MSVAEDAARTLVSVPEAQALIEQVIRPAPVERRPLESARGEVLREGIRADRDFPPFDRVTMDGIAFAHADFASGVRRFRLAGRQSAGMPPLVRSRRGECLEVMTGAVLPAGCDCVVRVEQIERDGSYATLRAEAAPVPSLNVHRRGSDFPARSMLLRPGVRLEATHLAICAAVGMRTVAVSARPRIAVVATGDELVDVETEPLPHQIRLSNSYALQALLAARGYTRVERFHTPDDRAALERLFGDLVPVFDIVVVTGGVSTGRLDYVPTALAALGVRPLFHKVRQRPGHPMWFGADAAGVPVFALPGNPVPMMVCACRYLLPFLERCAASTPRSQERAALAKQVEVDRPHTLFLPVKLEQRHDCVLVAFPRPVHGSGDFVRLAESDGFLELAEKRASFEAGSVLPLYRWGTA